MIYLIVQKSVTRKGTLKSTINPWNMDRIAYFSPEYRVITGSVVSIDVAPPAEIGASFPKNRTRTGAPNRVMISLIMLAGTDCQAIKCRVVRHKHRNQGTSGQGSNNGH